MNYKAFPGGDLIEGGVKDLTRGVESPEALLVAIGKPRLTRLGIFIPNHPFTSPELRLYANLSQPDSDRAHSRYNAMIRRLVSFERAAECAS